MRQCLCARRCLTGFQCRYEIIAVGGGVTSHKRLREKKRGGEKKEETMLRSEKQQLGGQAAQTGRHVHTSYGGRKLPSCSLCTRRDFDTLSQAMFYLTQMGGGGMSACAYARVSLS